MTLWLAIFGMGIVTYAIRLVPIWLLERATISADWRQALRFVPAAVLSAIILPELVMSGGTLDLSLGNARLLAGLVAILIAWRTKNILWTLAVGMVLLWVLG